MLPTIKSVQSNTSSLRGLLLLLLLLALTQYPISIAQAESLSLDALFKQLKVVTTEDKARELENQIWKKWLSSGDPKIDKLMQAALRARRSYNFNGALEILNQVVELKPEFPEVWNQRATVYFHQEQYKKSLEDIAKTLELEPRHFGSLAGRAVIRLKQKKPALAIQNIKVALEFHPYLKERNMFPNL